MTKVRLDNDNTSVDKYYLELAVMNLEHNFLNSPISYPKVLPAASWSTAPLRYFYDMKNINEEFEVTATIDNTSSYTDSGYGTVATTTNVYAVKAKLIAIFESGGVINFKIVLDAGSPSTYTGLMTSLKISENPEDQEGTAPPDIMDIRFKILIGENQ